MASTEEILRRAEQDIEEERLWREKLKERKSMQEQEHTTEKTEDGFSRPSIERVTKETQLEVLSPSLENLRREVFQSTRLINSSASALHSHMRDILSLEDVRPTLARTEQATTCAREIALLMKAQGDLLRAMRDSSRKRDEDDE